MTGHDERAHDERPGIDVTGDVDPADIRHDEQPAPTAREIPADELAEAERYVQGLAQHSPALRRVLDERGRERDAARAELAQLRGWHEQVKAENERLHRDRDRRNEEQLADEAVVQAWRERIAPARTQHMEHLVRMFIGNVLTDKLDELARAHEARDGGQDR